MASVYHSTGSYSFTDPKTVAILLTDLGVAKSHSRPHVSNDNPYSEAQFKTLKYRPDYPDRFGSLADARQWAPASLPGTTSNIITAGWACCNAGFCTTPDRPRLCARNARSFFGRPTSPPRTLSERPTATSQVARSSLDQCARKLAPPEGPFSPAERTWAAVAAPAELRYTPVGGPEVEQRCGATQAPRPLTV